MLDLAVRGDRKLVVTAVSQNGHALQHVSEELRSNPEIVMKAVSQLWDPTWNSFAACPGRAERRPGDSYEGSVPIRRRSATCLC